MASAKKSIVWLAIVVLLLIAGVLYLAGRSKDAQSPQQSPATTAASPEMQYEPDPYVPAPRPTPAPAAPASASGAEILAAASASGGQVLAYSGTQEPSPVAVAHVIEPQTVLTTCHALPTGAKLSIRVGATHHPAEVAMADEQLGLCRLSVPDLPAPALELASAPPQPGDPIVVVGMNAEGAMAATEGTFARRRESPQGQVLEISVPIAEGGSGGGVFDRHGRLVGIATTGHEFGPGVHVALPAAWIAQMKARSRLQ